MTALVPISAWLYALLAGLVIAFQLAMALGAPWGHLTLGGQYPGRFDGGLRLLALAQALLLVGMALAVLSAAGLGPLHLPRFTLWIALALTALTVLANAATAAPLERLIWLPIALGMLVTGLVVAFAGRS